MSPQWGDTRTQAKEVVFRKRLDCQSMEVVAPSTMTQVAKLRVIVRSDIPKGYMMSQAMHAGIDYVLKHDAMSWWQTSNTLVVLEVADEAKILELAQVMESEGIKHVVFREPAMGYQATSIALDPEDERAKNLTKRLKLALA